MRKNVFYAMSFVFLLLFLFIPRADTKVRPYYSGDAIVYRGSVIIGSTNTGNLEIFRYINGGLFKATTIKPITTAADNNKSFFDLAFDKDKQDRLLVYAVDGRYINIYDISKPDNPILVNKIKDNSWDWFSGIDVAGDYIVTKGTRGVKIWNKNFEVVDSFPLIKNQLPYNLSLVNKGTLILNLDKNNLQITDAKTRRLLTEVNIDSRDGHNRRIYNDEVNNAIYLTDDKSFKQFDYNGALLNSYAHASNLGYDVAGLDYEAWLYFTDGVGVVKINRFDFKPITWVYTDELGGKGGWAMGLKVLSDGSSDKVVVFNNNNILLLDNNLKYLAGYKATAEDITPRENLFLNLDKIRAASNSLVSLRGGGFGSNENLSITWASRVINAKANEDGRFSLVLTVPDVKPAKADIKVAGNISGLSYSIGFQIE